MGTVSRTQDIRAPEKLSPGHDLSDFNSGMLVLDDWLLRRALSNEDRGISRTYVICVGERVVGYYALAGGAVTSIEATGRTRRNIPDPVPVMVLVRLAIDSRHQGCGIGRALLRDAILRTMRAADIAGIRAIVVHALSEGAKWFYERCGFQPSPIDPMTLMITLGGSEKENSGTEN